jgi:hypothetical protein
MKMRSPSALVVELGRIAGRAEPPPLDNAEAFIDRALRTTPELEPRPRSRWPLVLAFAAAAAVIWWLVPRASVPEAVPSVLRVTLPTGDHVIGVAGAQFDVEKLAPNDRRLRVHGGLVLFDVAHVVAGQRFQVVTDHLTATAKGTVFSVEDDAIRTRVRVYEGVVEVEQGGVVQPLVAGAIWDSATQTTAIALQRPAALADSVDAAIRARVAPPVIAHAPPPPPPVATVPVAITASAVKPARELQPSPVSVDDLFATARADIDAGKQGDALAIARRVAARGPLTGPWWQVIGDASRGLGRTADAADAFDNAARTLAGAERSEAGYSAAYLHFHDLHEPVIALTSLIASQADAEGSPLEERALGLRAQILVALGRRDEARAVAVRYIARFPHSDLQTFMLALTR